MIYKKANMLIGAGAGAGLGGLYGATDDMHGYSTSDKIKNIGVHALAGAGLGAAVGGGVKAARSLKNTKTEIKSSIPKQESTSVKATNATTPNKPSGKVNTSYKQGPKVTTEKPASNTKVNESEASSVNSKATEKFNTSVKQEPKAETVRPSSDAKVNKNKVNTKASEKFNTSNTEKTKVNKADPSSNANVKMNAKSSNAQNIKNVKVETKASEKFTPKSKFSVDEHIKKSPTTELWPRDKYKKDSHFNNQVQSSLSQQDKHLQHGISKATRELKAGRITQAEHAKMVRQMEDHANINKSKINFAADKHRNEYAKTVKTKATDKTNKGKDKRIFAQKARGMSPEELEAFKKEHIEKIIPGNFKNKINGLNEKVKSGKMSAKRATEIAEKEKAIRDEYIEHIKGFKHNGR